MPHYPMIIEISRHSNKRHNSAFFLLHILQRDKKVFFTEEYSHLIGYAFQRGTLHGFFREMYIGYIELRIFTPVPAKPGQPFSENR